jgi:hypothetical protein
LLKKPSTVDPECGEENIRGYAAEIFAASLETAEIGVPLVDPHLAKPPLALSSALIAASAVRNSSAGVNGS